MEVMDLAENGSVSSHGQRDIDEIAEVGLLMKLNYFSEKFNVYSTAYVEDGTVFFRMHEKADPLYAFCDTAAVDGLFPIPVERHALSIKVANGAREETRGDIYRSIADSLVRDVPEEIFRLQMNYAALEANNAAYAIFDQWRRDLIACFRADRIQLFEGALLQALEAKHLSIHAYREFLVWAQDRREQIYSGGSWGKRKTFSGFMYLSKGSWQTFSDAVPSVVFAQKDRLQCQGKYCSPTVSTTYSLEEMPSWRISQWKQRFEESLDEALDERSRARLDELRALKPRLDEGGFRGLIEKMEVSKKEKAAKIIRRYGIRWGIMP